MKDILPRKEIFSSGQAKSQTMQLLMMLFFVVTTEYPNQYIHLQNKDQTSTGLSYPIFSVYSHMQVGVYMGTGTKTLHTPEIIVYHHGFHMPVSSSSRNKMTKNMYTLDDLHPNIHTRMYDKFGCCTFEHKIMLDLCTPSRYPQSQHRSCP